MAFKRQLTKKQLDESGDLIYWLNRGPELLEALKQLRQDYQRSIEGKRVVNLDEQFAYVDSLISETRVSK